jgi:hypothetical protein
VILASQARQGHAALLGNRARQVMLALWVISALLVGLVSRVIQGQRALLVRRAQQVLRALREEPVPLGLPALLA